MKINHNILTINLLSTLGIRCKAPALDLFVLRLITNSHLSECEIASSVAEVLVSLSP